VRTSRLWAQMLGCENTVIEDVDWHEDDTGQLAVTVHVRPCKRLAGRCPACGKKRPGYDQGQGRRRQSARARWIWARSGPSWRPPRRGWPARSTGW
jgi:transposase